ncbi:hypothetical protein BUALT_Bualt01G0158200 [Buddleja alternifolia]|uniref:Uncharacterized protein n=1 Tax=Buddleja alternifolia TaxID=168488 RepID=A0AAV6Y9T9_9LAMI|nr:hypothetical protein BUALT_Bualt01G0158200 [Buddleja alternifolia]
MEDPPLLRGHGEKSVSAITAKSEADITTSASAIMSHESRILRRSPIAGKGYFVVAAAHFPSFSSRRKPIASVIAARRGYFVVAAAHSPSFSSRWKPIAFVIAARRGYFVVAAAHSPSFLAREPPAEGKFPPLDLVTSHINRRRLDNTSEDKNEPYILSTQAEQVWYVDEPLDFFMAGKRKRSGRSVIDVIRERARSSAMHDSPLRDRGLRVHLQSRFGSTSSLPLHDASHSSSSGILVNPSEDCHNIGHPAPYFLAEHHVSDLPSCSGDIFQANGNSNHSHCAPSVPIEHHNRADFPSCSGTFSLQNNEAKSYVLEDFNEKWKQRKYELKKKYFRPYQNDPEKLKELAVDLVPPEQFKYLVDYWKLVETQEEAERNTQNIAQHKFHHNLGRTPILELKKKILLIEGKFPSRIDILCESRPVTSETSNLIKQMRDSISRVPEAERTAELEERVWIEFMGEDGHGRVKCAGRGIKPSKRRHTLSSNEVIKKKIQEVVQEVEEKMRGEKEQMRKEIDDMKEEREKMKGLMEQMEKKMSQTREEMTQEVVENVVSYFRLGHFPVAPFIGQSAATFRPFEFRQEPDSSSVSGTMSVGASTSSKDLAWSGTKPQGKPSTNRYKFILISKIHC